MLDSQPEAVVVDGPRGTLTADMFQPARLLPCEGSRHFETMKKEPISDPVVGTG